MVGRGRQPAARDPLACRASQGVQRVTRQHGARGAELGTRSTEANGAVTRTIGRIRQGAAARTHSRDELHVRAAGPHLRGRLAIPPPAEHVAAGLEVGGDLDDVPDRALVRRALAAVARRRERSPPVPEVITARAVTPCGARARRARPVGKALVRVRVRVRV